MSQSVFLASILGPFLLILGLSFLIYLDAWNKVIQRYLKDHLKLLPTMVMELVFGLYIVATHNVWEWSPYAIITVMGWLMVAEPVIYFLVPGDRYKSIVKSIDCKCYYQTFGAVYLVLGGWLSYLVYFN